MTQTNLDFYMELRRPIGCLNTQEKNSRESHQVHLMCTVWSPKFFLYRQPLATGPAFNMEMKCVYEIPSSPEICP